MKCCFALPLKKCVHTITRTHTELTSPSYFDFYKAPNIYICDMSSKLVLLFATVCS